MGGSQIWQNTGQVAERNKMHDQSLQQYQDSD